MSQDRKRKASEDPSVGLPSDELIVIGGEGKTGEIPDELVVRATSLTFSMEEIERFGEKSRARCPTYGNCSICFNSGPVGKTCTCRHGTYTVFMAYKNDDDKDKMFMLDAERFAKLFKKDHEIAMVDRTFSWIRTPTMYFRRPHIVRMVIDGLQPQIEEAVLKICQTLYGPDYKKR